MYIQDNADRTSSFVVLINLLRPLDPSRWPSPASSETVAIRNQKFSDLVVKCLIKLTKVIFGACYFLLVLYFFYLMWFDWGRRFQPDPQPLWGLTVTYVLKKHLDICFSLLLELLLCISSLFLFTFLFGVILSIFVVQVLQSTIYDVDLDRILQSIHIYLQELGMEEIRRRYDLILGLVAVSLYVDARILLICSVQASVTLIFVLVSILKWMTCLPFLCCKELERMTSHCAWWKLFYMNLSSFVELQ